ncbi:MAG: M1 family metallopeptidase [Calditrichaeota bacterium]|nr:M1 family metallopeptidase [Calditrichota bacterium]
MKSRFFLAFLFSFCFVLSPLFSQEAIFKKPLSPRIANYDIDVRLDAAKFKIYGKEKLHWVNKTGETIRELQFHLYLNGFRNSKSTFMKESGGSHRGYKLEKDGWGYIEVDQILREGGSELTDRLEFIQPDDNNPDDKTVFRLPLKRPIPPGKSITLNIDFHAKLPQPPFARSGAWKEYFFVGQWFPKVGVFQNGKWNCHQYHRNSEFFSDFGVYNVKITVPKENIVGATGLLQEVTENDDGTKTHFYHAEDVHDFAWTTSPEFVEFTKQIEDVKVRLLLQKDHAAQAERHFAAITAAIEFFQKNIGDYPYPNLTIVDPRRGAQGSGGMEYPTLITAGTFYHIPKGLRMPEMVTVHEFGHNYWYGMVASNEFEEAWLDEGINSYTETLIMDSYYGPKGSMFDMFGVKVSDIEFQRSQYIQRPDVDPVVKPSWEYYPSGSYGVNSYQKPATLLKTLENYLGTETMFKILHAYFERWKFRHPKTQDFIQVANEVSGQDLNWFFDQALFSTKTLDYSVRFISSRKVKKDKGYDVTVSVSVDSLEKKKNENDSLSAASDTLKAERDSTAKDSTKFYESKVYVRRLGDFIFPVEVKFVFDNGDTLRENWDGKDHWKIFTYVKPAKLVSATVDPDNKILLDVSLINNSKTMKKQKAGINKITSKWLFLIQSFLDEPDLLNLFSILMSIS